MKSPIILRIFKNDKLLEVKQFDDKQVIFGNDGDVTMELKDPAVSSIHCLIELRDSGYYVCDMGSASGTKKNGEIVLDEPISSGDNIEIGPFRVQFFVGAPKPKEAPTPVATAPATPPKAAKVPTPPPAKPASLPVAPPASVAPPKPAPPKLPEAQKSAAKVAVIDDEKTDVNINVKTFAPPSEIEDLRTYLKATKGPIVEVIVAWHERILSTYHCGADQNVSIGSGKSATIAIPAQFMAGTQPFLELKGGCKVLAPMEAHADMINAAQEVSTLEEMQKAGKVIKVGSVNAIRMDQGELICLSFGGGTLQVFVRYVSNTIKPILAAPLDFSAGELTGLIISLVIVSLTALYMSVYSPPPPEEEKKEEEVRLAKFIYNKPPPIEKVETPPPEKIETPPPTTTMPPKKVQVTEKEKPTQQKGNKESKAPEKQTVAAKAAEVRPMPTKVNRPKKFTSIHQGGAVAISKTASANAQSAKDVNKMGLLSAFGGGGVRQKLDQAYSGSGELLGMADRATGTSGQNDNRSGDDIGSKFKDTGAGGKGTATQGIAGVGTKGRGSGMNAYGSGLGGSGKSNVSIDAGGAEEGWDGTIDREAVRRVIRSILSQIKSCYERQLRTNSQLSGKIVIQFEIMEQGRVRLAKTKNTTMNDPAVESCVASRIREARFPEPPPGTIAVVDFPFVFDAQK